MRPIVIAAALAVAALPLAAATARAESQGILTCQIALTQFSEDVVNSKARLRPGHLAAAAQLVEVGRSQCRSGPAIVLADITAMRQALPLTTGGGQVARGGDDFWPPSDEELAALVQ